MRVRVRRELAGYGGFVLPEDPARFGQGQLLCVVAPQSHGVPRLQRPERRVECPLEEGHVAIAVRVGMRVGLRPGVARVVCVK